MYSWPAIYKKHHYSRYYPKFLQSPTLCKFQLEYISSGDLKLLDFLLGDTTLFYFMEVRFCHVYTRRDWFWWCWLLCMCQVYSSFCRLHACLQLSEFLESCLSISPDSTWSERKHPLFSSFGWQRRVFTQTCLVLAIHLILKQPWLMQLPSTKGAKTHS